MEYYVGLDVSLKQTSICVVDQAGLVVREGVVGSDPEAISVFVRSKAPGAVRIGLETGPTSTWLWTELKRLDLPVICIDARHAKAVLKMQINKNDRNDAIGIARIMQTGWFKEVHVKDIDSHSVRALLASRALLVKIKRDLENHVRGLLKNLGLVIGRATFNVFAVRAEELIEDRPDLVAAVRPLLEARNAVEQQVSELDRKVMKLARRDAQVQRSEGQALPPGRVQMTVAELIEKLSALPDKTARVVKSPGPWDGLNEPDLIYEGYVDKDLQFPVQATDPDAIHVVYL